MTKRVLVVVIDRTDFSTCKRRIYVVDRSEGEDMYERDISAVKLNLNLSEAAVEAANFPKIWFYVRGDGLARVKWWQF